MSEIIGKTTTQLRIDTLTYEKARYISIKELRSMNNQLEYFVKKGVEAYEQEHGETITIDDVLGLQGSQ